MKKLDIKEVKNQARGHWFEILATNGMNSRFLNNKNGPCPFCGGKDRWRWDNKAGDGGGYCHQCDAKGDGISILAKWTGLSRREDFGKLLKLVSDSMGFHSAESRFPSADLEIRKKKFNKDQAEKIWNTSEPITDASDNPATRYLRIRGLRKSLALENLRYCPSLEYREGKTVVGSYPALVAKVTGSDNRFLGIHRIYLDDSGNKASVVAVKMALGAISGGTIKFDLPEGVLNVAEGVETALAVREITNTPTWAAISAGNMEHIEIPEGIRTVIIWGDRDVNKRGERAAHELSRFLYHMDVQAIINMPPLCFGDPQGKMDWLDIYNLVNSDGGDHV